MDSKVICEKREKSEKSDSAAIFISEPHRNQLRVELKVITENETKASRIGDDMLSGLSTELATALIVIHGAGHNSKLEHSPNTFMAGEPTSRREFGYGKNEQSIPLTTEEKASKLFQITPEQKDAMFQKHNSAGPKSNPNLEKK